MGVLSTYCQICGLPVQQDHYVPAEGGGYFHIWRGDGHDECAPIIDFGPDHAWLRDAVGLRYDESSLLMATVSGLVHDGDLESPAGPLFGADLMDGEGDERVALHAACWELAGRPSSWEALGHDRGLPVEHEVYRQQLFDFAGFVSDGFGWALVDPGLDGGDGLRSRRRIVGIVGG